MDEREILMTKNLDYETVCSSIKIPLGTQAYIIY
jgi:hypothetical protein